MFMNSLNGFFNRYRKSMLENENKTPNDSEELKNLVNNIEQRINLNQHTQSQ